MSGFIKALCIGGPKDGEIVSFKPKGYDEDKFWIHNYCGHHTTREYKLIEMKSGDEVVYFWSEFETLEETIKNLSIAYRIEKKQSKALNSIWETVLEECRNSRKIE